MSPNRAKNRTGRTLVVTGTVLALATLPAGARADEHKIELGGFVGWHVFSTTNELGVFDDMDSLAPDSALAFGARLGVNLHPRLALEAELAVVPSTAGDANLTVFGWRGQFLVHLATEGKVRPFLLVGGGGMSASSGDSTEVAADTDMQLHGGAGLKLDVTDDWGLRLDGRVMLPPSSEDDSFTQDYEVLVGFYGRFPQAKRQPVVIIEEEPEPPADPDEDGLVGALDQCPDKAEDKDGFQDEDGCPDPDNDDDGVGDAIDAEPNKPEDKDGFQDEDGAPEADNDNDGVLDGADKEPNAPEDKDGFQDEDGAPELDNDQDGVLDGNDKCPDQLETMNGFQDGDGCEDKLPKEIAKFTGTIKGINFDNGKSTIKKGSFGLLDKAVDVLNQYPDLRIEISGHTDDQGERDFNMKLSQDRADAVKQYFVGKGIDPSRIETVGYGPDKPLVENKNKASRAKNRRIEFKLLSTPAPPTTPQ
jgi:outer membrane protein OmpA-like peptidoglycan-associated protein